MHEMPRGALIMEMPTLQGRDDHYKIEVPKNYLNNVDKGETINKTRTSSNVDKALTQKEAGSDVVHEGLAKLIAESAEKFQDYVDNWSASSHLYAIQRRRVCLNMEEITIFLCK